MHVHMGMCSVKLAQCQASSLREGVAPREVYTCTRIADTDKKAGTMGPEPRNSLYYCGHCDKQLSKTVSSEYKRRPTAKDLKVLVFHLFLIE